MLISKMVKVLGTYPLSTATDFEGSEKPKGEPIEIEFFVEGITKGVVGGLGTF